MEIEESGTATGPVEYEIDVNRPKKKGMDLEKLNRDHRKFRK